MPKVILMGGVPASGKSTFAKMFCKEMRDRGVNTIYISRDEIRYSLLKDEDKYFSKEAEVKKVLQRKIASSKNADYVVIDATHLNPASRGRTQRMAASISKDIMIYYIMAPLELCLKRNALRQGRERVSDDALTSMYYTQRAPKPSIDRGFSKIVLLNENFKKIEE